MRARVPKLGIASRAGAMRVCIRGRNAWRSVVISRIIRSENRGYAGRVACGWGVTTANVLTSSARAQSVRPAVRYVVIRGA